MAYYLSCTSSGGRLLQKIITVTNYSGKHRDYLKKLILTMGAEFTPSMSNKNTAVIAA